MKKGLLIVICGPSGVGKGTITRILSGRLPGVVQSVSVTTRKPRPDEKEGVHYYFRSEEEFEAMKNSNELLEHAETFNHHYGTPRFGVESNIKTGKDVLLEIDVKGAKQVKKTYPDCVTFFIVPPTMEDLKTRLHSRGTEDEKELDLRYTVAEEEILQSAMFDYVIVNDDPERAVDEIIEGINKKRK